MQKPRDLRAWKLAKLSSRVRIGKQHKDLKPTTRNESWARPCKLNNLGSNNFIQASLWIFIGEESEEVELLQRTS
ncbi:hypothetical protein STEG23_009238, partial [Scotinomys teguina]